MRPGDVFMADGVQCVAVPVEDYQRLLEATESDDMIVRCETCSAWLDRNDPARASTEDFEGCWKAATLRKQDSRLCRSYRALELVSNADELPAGRAALLHAKIAKGGNDG